MDAAIAINQVIYGERNARYAVDAHRREDYQWYHVIYGTVEQQYEDERFVLEAGCGILYPPGVLRRPRVAPDQSRPPGYFWVNFNNLGLKLDTLYGQILRIPPTLESDIDGLIDTIRRQDLPQRDILLRALTERLLLGLVVAAHDGREARRPPLNRAAEQTQVAAAQDFIDQHLSEPITRDDIAAAAHCSPAHLARLFRDQLDRSVGEWLTHQRIACAKELLVGSDASIAQIAGQVGYSSYSHFTQLFRREVGITPSAYRRAGGKSWR